MPNVRKSKSTRRRRRRPRRRAVIRRSPMPTTFLTKFKFQSTVSLDPTVGGLPDVHVFRANGMFDPNRTGVGHQPRGFDELMALYDHFTVIGSRIRVQFCYDTAASNAKAEVALALRDSDVVGSTYNDYAESGYVKTKLLGFTSQPATTMTMSANPPKFLGRSKPMSDPQLKGSASADPAEQAFWHVVAGGIDTDIGTLWANVEIEYLAVLSEPKNPTRS